MKLEMVADRAFIFTCSLCRILLPGQHSADHVDDMADRAVSQRAGELGGQRREAAVPQTPAGIPLLPLPGVAQSKPLI